MPAQKCTLGGKNSRVILTTGLSCQPQMKGKEVSPWVAVEVWKGREGHGQTVLIDDHSNLLLVHGK